MGATAFIALRTAWPAYAAAEPDMRFSLSMQIARLVVGVGCAVVAGAVASRTSHGGVTAASILGGALLAVFIPIHCSLWDRFPLWYHLTFLPTLAPLVGVGGRLGQRASRRETVSASQRSPR